MELDYCRGCVTYLYLRTSTLTGPQMSSNATSLKQTHAPCQGTPHFYRVLLLPFVFGLSGFYVYFAHIRLIEYDYWEQFESIQRLPQRRPLIHAEGVRA